MKKFARITTFLFAVLFLLSFLPRHPAFAADIDMRYGRKKLGEMSNGAALQFAYDQLVAGCAADTPSTISLAHNQHSVSINEFTNYVFPMFYADYPEYFWVTNGGYGYSYANSQKILSVEPNYHKGFANLSAAKSAFNAKVNQLTAGLSGSDYDKAKALHDRLIQAVTYTSAANDQNAYGAIVEGKAVCNGYARAYKHLLQKAGIPAWYVRGSSINPTTNKQEDHAWNLVKLDGRWYYTDVTWDDQGNHTFYAYFNITTQQLLTDHVLSSDYAALVPQATATDANFYLKEGRNFSGYDRAKLVTLLKKDANTTQFSVTGNKNAFLSALDADLLNLGAALGGTGAFRISYNYTSLGNALILNVALVSENHVHRPKTNIAQVKATCLANGTKAYVICDCGLKFLDNACTQPLSDEKQLTIPAVSHNPSGWKNDATSHWKECTACGSETANTRGSHGDSNKDNKCDTCGYTLPIADKNNNTNVNNTTPNNQNPGTQPPVSTQPVVPVPTTPTASTEATSATESSQPSAATDSTQPGATTDDASAATITTESTNTGPKEDEPAAASGSGKPFLIGGVVIVVAGVTGLFLWSKKRMR